MRLYCIEHEEMFEAVSTEACPLAHDLGTISYFFDGAVVVEPNYCCFDQGFAFAPPPTMEPVNLEAPCLEEIEQFELFAQESLTDFS